MLELFASKRRELEECYERLTAVIGALDCADLCRNMENARQELQDEAFQVLVIGEFSRGKSMLVNAMLGERLLPAKATPTTAITSKIMYGASKSFALHYRDSGKVVQITADEFMQMRIEEGTDYGDIAYAEIRYPFEICRNGITLIDTPGPGYLDELQEEIIYRYMPEADAVVFVLSATQAYTKSELDFLRDRVMASDRTKLFFAVNFKDRLEEAENERQVLDMIRGVLAPIVPNLRVFMVSSKQALDFRRREPIAD